MAITILAPAPAVPYQRAASSSDDDSDDGGVDLEGDLDMRPSKRARRSGGKEIVTPGEVVTDDPQWMRYEKIHGSWIPSSDFRAEAMEHILHQEA